MQDIAAYGEEVLPYTGAGTTSAGIVAGGLLAAGGLLLLATRHRRHGPSSPKA